MNVNRWGPAPCRVLAFDENAEEEPNAKLRLSCTVPDRASPGKWEELTVYFFSADLARKAQQAMQTSRVLLLEARAEGRDEGATVLVGTSVLPLALF